MKQLSWNNITVRQFQKIHQINDSPDLDDIGRIQSVISTLFTMSDNEIDNLTITEVNQLAKQCARVMNEEVPGKPVKQIKIGRKRYSIIYDPTKLRHRQYVEVLHFGDRPIDQMHSVMASIVQPVTWYGRKLKNEAEQHEKIANDMLDARIIDVYHSCVFFCKLYVSLIENIKPYLIHEMMMEGAKMGQARTILNSLQSVTAGFITQKKWQPLRV